MYNISQEFLSCFLFMINPFNRGLPHIATMGRDEILQQTPLKHPQIAPDTHGKVLRPIMTTQLIKLIFIG